MKFLEEHKLAITILTPVHIGCGEDYTPTDYVIEDDALFAFDSAGVSDALSDQARAQLLNLVKGNQQSNVLTNIQNLFYNQREVLIASSSHYLRVAKGIADLYQKRIGKTAQTEDDGKKVINGLEIERAFYNPVSQRPVIPGSSLKGAVRTALLDLVNMGKPCQGKETNRQLQRRLFKYEKFEQDPLRLVKLEDTQCVKNDVVHSEIRFAVNRPRQEPKPSPTARATAKEKRPPQLLETLPELNLRAFKSRLTIQKINQVPHSDKLPATEFHWTIKQVVHACNRFYLPLFKRETEIIRQRRYAAPAWLARMDELLAGIIPLLEAEKAMLLRVGRHSGAEAVTLNGVRSIKIMQGPGKQPKYEPQPQTLWLAADVQDSRSEMMPFGWVLVEIDPQEKPPFPKELIGEDTATKRRWATRQQQRLTELRDKLSRRKQQEEMQLQAERDEQRAEKERQERLAAMTDEQREIQELREAFEKAQASGALAPQGPVPGRLSDLMKKASGWPYKDRNELCDLAESIYKPLGMLKGKKGRERKEKIQQLKG